MPQRRPNILIFITHDTGRHLGCYGADVETPSINRLAERGVLLTQAYCTAPQCSPSRGSLLTGMVPHRHGLIGLAHRGFRLRPGVALLPRILAEAGYSTHLFGIQHETHHLRAAELGYQVQHPVKDTSCESLAHAVKDFLSSAPSQPFFASVGSFETHRPYPKAAPPPKSLRVPPYLPDAPEVRQDIADLQTAVRRVDHALGQIVSALQEHRLWENTLFIYTPDHGIAFPDAKATLFDPGVEIALLMHGAGFEGGKRIDGLVSNMDILPTLCEVAELESPQGIDGKSLVPLLQGKVKQIHHHLLWSKHTTRRMTPCEAFARSDISTSAVLPAARSGYRPTWTTFIRRTGIASTSPRFSATCARPTCSLTCRQTLWSGTTSRAIRNMNRCWQDCARWWTTGCARQTTH